MSTLGRVIGTASVVGGALGALVVGGISAERKALRHYRDLGGLSAGAEVFAPDEQRGDRHYSVVSEDGLRLQVTEFGPLDADVTVIFAHGWLLRSAAWYFQQRQLIGPGFGMGGRDLRQARLVCFDQRSHGRSGRGSRQQLTVEALSHDVAAVIAASAPSGPVVLVGHSMGGMAILTLAQRQPELFGPLVAGVGLIATSVRYAEGRDMRALLLGRNPLFKALAGTIARYPSVFDRTRSSGKQTAWLATRSFGFGRPDVPGPVVDFANEMIASTPTDVLAAFAPSLMSHDARAGLGALAAIPVTVICGDRDRVTPLPLSMTITATLPQAHLVVVKQAGHMVALEAPDEVSQALRELLVTVADHRDRMSKGRKP